MRADELLVERFLELEKKLKLAKKIIDDLKDDNETAKEELADYENLVRMLSKHLKVTKYGVFFEIKNYIEEEKADIDFLANYFDVTFEEETQDENG
jgi:phage regulator Rha-like protein